MRSLSCMIGLLLLPTALVQAGIPDCDKAMAPQRCASYRQAWLSCKDMTDGAARACIEQYTPALSCKRSRDARQCEALQAAQQACDGTEGAARRAVCVNACPQPIAVTPATRRVASNVPLRNGNVPKPLASRAVNVCARH
jgi:hypothetical protein